MTKAPTSPGSKRTVAELYKEYGPAVYRRCLRLVKNPEAARDATQEVFLKLVRDEAKLQDRETVLPWMYRVATNHCLNLRRTSQSRGEESVTPDLDVASTVPVEIYPDRALAQAVLSRFDAATQAVAVGVLVDGMEQQEVAEALGVSRRTVARKLERFLESARKYLDAVVAQTPPARC